MTVDTAATAARPRVLFINRSYWPDAEATGQLLTELCEDLAERFDITVLCGQPNANLGRSAFRRTGYDERGGVTIRRVWNTRLPKRWLVAKAINLLTYFGCASWVAFWLRRPDVIVVETDPPLLCLLGALLRRWFDVPLVVYLQDIYPDIAVALGKLPSGWLTRRLRSLMFGVYRTADRVVVLSEDMRAVLIEAQVPAERIAVVPNWIDTGRVRPQPDPKFRDTHQLAGQFVVMYSGNVGLCQRLEDIITAAALTRQRSDIQWLIVGEGALKAELQATARRQGLQNVTFLPYQPKDQLADSLSAADVQLVPIDPRVVRFLMPSKLYGVLAAGKALIAVAPAGCDLARVTAAADCGLVVEPDDPAALAEVVRNCADGVFPLAAMGHRSRALAEQEYDRARVTARFGDLLFDILELSPAAAVRLFSDGDTATDAVPAVNTDPASSTAEPHPIGQVEP